MTEALKLSRLCCDYRENDWNIFNNLKRILFICEFNIIRSPTAELLIKKILNEKLHQTYPDIGNEIFRHIKIDSAGLKATKFDRIKREMSQVLYSYFRISQGQIIMHEPKKFDPKIHLDKFGRNIIFTMSEDQKRAVLVLLEDQDIVYEVRNLAEYGGDQEQNPEIVDPEQKIKNINKYIALFKNSVLNQTVVSKNDEDAVMDLFYATADHIYSCVSACCDQLIREHCKKHISLSALS